MHVGCLLFHLMRLDELNDETLGEALALLQAVADEPPQVEIIARMKSVFDTERVSEDDIEEARLRLNTSEHPDALPPAGSAVDVYLRGAELTWVR